MTKKVMKIPSMVYHMKITNQCMKVLFLIGLQEFFRLKLVEIDARRVHEFLTSLQNNGTCRIANKDGELIKLMVDSDMVATTLRLIQGEHNVSGLKLSLEEKKSVFRMRDDTSSEMD